MSTLQPISKNPTKEQDKKKKKRLSKGTRKHIRRLKQTARQEAKK